MRTVDCIQNTPEWLHVRCGRLTASRMGDVVAKRKKGPEEMACRRDYRMELLCERLTGRVAEHYVSPEMDRGSSLEPFACAAYEVATGSIVDAIGFVLHPAMDFSGASPDRLVDHDGGLEVKCPKTATHLEWIMAGVVPEEHLPQIDWNLACTGREWWEFLSFDDRLPEGLRIFTARRYRDEKVIAAMEYEAMEFNAELEKICAALGYPDCTPKAPIIRHRSTETERIGALDVPSDLMNVLEGERFDLRRVP